MSGEIRSLTGLRGVAATAVMVDHYMAVDFSTRFPWFLLPHAYVAVDMFMMLSGFVLAMSYEARFRVLPRRASLVLFYRHRIARLYPMYFVMTLVCFVLCRLGWLTFLKPDSSLAALATNLLAVQTWLWPGSSLDGPGWSISTEWAANLVFPLLLPAILGRSPLRAGAITALAFAALVVSAVLWGTLFDVPARGVVNIISGPEALGRCISEFVIGMVLWRLRSRMGGARVLARDDVQAVIVAGLGLLMVYPSLDVVLVALAGLLVLGLSYDRSALSRFLGSGLAHALGVISYSIYLVHIALLPLRDWLAQSFDAAGLPHGWIAAVACCTAATLVLATLSYRLLEKPAQRWLNRTWTAKLAV